MGHVDAEVIGVAGDRVAVEVLAADRGGVEDRILFTVGVEGGHGVRARVAPGLIGLEEGVGVVVGIHPDRLARRGHRARALVVADEDVLGRRAVGSRDIADVEGVGDRRTVGGRGRTGLVDRERARGMGHVDAEVIGVAGDRVAVEVLAADRGGVEDRILFTVGVEGGHGVRARVAPGLIGLEEGVGVVVGIDPDRLARRGHRARALVVADEDVLGRRAVGSRDIADVEGVGDRRTVGGRGRTGLVDRERAGSRVPRRRP